MLRHVVMQVYLSGNLAKDKHMTALLKSTGARQLKRPPPPNPQGAVTLHHAGAGGAKIHTVMLYDAENALPPGVAKAEGILQLSHKWLLDSASCFEAQPFAKHVLN
jgi:hypothetical protein